MPFAMTGAIRIHYELEGDGPPLVLHTGSSFIESPHVTKADR